MRELKTYCAPFLPAVLFALLFATGLPAQQLPFRNIQAKDGLPSSEVYFTMQDHQGYLWFGTDAGISRYDGYSFRNYTSSDGLCDNTVFQVFEDHRQRLWCRTIGGCISYFEQERFVSIEASERIRREKGNQLITSLHVDKNDTLWLGLANQKILRIAAPYREKDLTVFQKEAATLLIFEDGFVYCASRYLSSGSPEQMPVEIRIKNTAVSLRDTLPFGFIIRQWQEPNGSIISTGRSLYRLREGRLSLLFEAPGIILSLFEDGSGRIWVGQIDEGLIILEPDEKGSYSIRQQYLKHDRLSYISQDFEGGIWICSLKNGLFYVPRTGIEQYTFGFLNSNRMIGITVSAGKIFGATYDGEIVSIEEQHPVNRVGTLQLRSKAINKRIYAAGGDTLLVANVDLEIVDAKTGRLLKYSPGIQTGALTDMTPAGGSEWYLANPVFVQRIDIRTGAVRDTFSMKGTRLNTLLFRKDTLWMGCLDGLWSYTRGKLHYYGNERPELKRRIDDIADMGPGGLLLATRSEGVIYFDGRKCRSIGVREGLSSPLCRSLLPVDSRSAWVGTSNGMNLLRLDPVPHVSRLIAHGDGIPASDILQMCFHRGRLCAATSNGIFLVDTAACFSSSAPPPLLHLLGIRIREKLTPIDSVSELMYNQNTVQFDFIGLSYKSSGRLTYRYRLAGLDSAWTASTATYARYASLPPGSYRFQIAAVNSNGQAGAMQEFAFSIDKPYWKKWWFIASYILLFVVSTVLIIRSRERRARLLARKDAEFKQRLAETELKALRAQMNPHFVFNAIGSIQNFILNNKNDDANKYLIIFAQLIRNVLEQSKEEMITLREETDTLRLYLGLEALRFKNRFQWNIRIDEHCDSAHVLVPPLLLQPFIENALWHGLGTLEKQGELNLTVRAEGEKLVCTIEDNGIGRKAAGELQKNRSKRTSLGTAISRERLASMEQLLGRKTELEITDLYDESGKSCGTRVKIILPLFRLA